MVFWIAEADIDLIIALIITLSVVSIITSFYSKKIWLKAIKNNIKKLEKDGKLPFEKVSTFILKDDCIIEKVPKLKQVFNMMLLRKLYVAIKPYMYILVPFKRL